MSESALNVKTMLFLSKTMLKNRFSFKISYSCRFGLRGNLDFPDFLQKKFYNINYRIAVNFSELLHPIVGYLS